MNRLKQIDISIKKEDWNIYFFTTQQQEKKSK